MAVVKEVNAEPIPGYRLLEPLGSGGFGEVWKCEAPGGICKAIKFVYGDLNGLDVDSARAEEELRAIQHVKAIRHPFLLSIERVESLGGELIIVTELADSNLHEVLLRYQEAGQAGIPRPELLSYLLETAEVLDLMNQQHSLQHLDIKPRNLFLVSKHVKVADFGLVNSLSGGNRIQLGAITPLYASPELFLGSFSRHSDQYSLAIVYQELLTGSLPFQGKNCRQMLLLHTQSEPDLRLLPESDRPVVARALAKDPEKRFASCAEFVHGLFLNKPNGTKVVYPRQLPESMPTVPQAATLPPAETISQKILETQMVRGRTGPPVPSDILPQYQFRECLGNSPLMDLWEVQAPDGRKRLLKLIYGFAHPDAQRTTEALVRLRSLLHPALVPFEVVQVDPGRLAVLTDQVEETLRDRAQECLTAKLPGIRRGELLGYLRAAAEALDYLFHQHSVQHLGLNPRTLVLTDDRLQMADFGLAQLLWLPAGQPVAQRNSRYAAPELFDNIVSPTSDQYSLALIYHELLTGTYPFRSSGPRGRGNPDVSKLSALDQEILTRALDAEPHKRWPSCSDLVRALEGLPTDPEDPTGPRGNRFDTLLKGSHRLTVAVPAEATSENLNQFLIDLLTSAGRITPNTDTAATPALSEADEVLRHTLTAGLPLGSARLKLQAFAQQWYAQLIREDEQGCVFHVSMPSHFWRQWIGRQPGLEVKIKLARVHALSATPIEAAVQIRPFRCSKKRGLQLLEEMGPQLLESLRTFLLVNSEKRLQDRLLWPHPLRIRPLYPDGKQGEEIECRGKDISISGIGFYLPHELATSEVLIHLPNTLRPPYISIPATLVRAKPCADGWYEVGALFRLPALRKSMPEMCLAQG